MTRDDVLACLRDIAGVLAENKDYLTELDAAIGDADHGVNMDRGFQAVLGKLPAVQDKDIGTILKTAGMTLVSTVGGAAGPLYGTFFLRMGTAAANKMELDGGDLVAMLEAGVQGIIDRGKAAPGEKTMLDALLPALAALRSAVAEGLAPGEALQRAAAAAGEGMRATIPMVARKGRASYLGERSVGHQDPGATSSYLMLKVVAQRLATKP